MSGKGFRVFGIEFGGFRGDLDDRFQELTEKADRAGVQWRDLVQEGYRVPGDLFVGSLRMRYDWDWRIRELRRVSASSQTPITAAEPTSGAVSPL